MDRKIAFEKMVAYSDRVMQVEEPLNNKLIREVRNRNHVILSGPPGTGKTRAVDLLLAEIREEVGDVEVIQFHPNYSYQDFIEGYAINDGRYEPRKGILLEFLDKIRGKDDSKLAIFVIDEINRGDIPSIFGELMVLLDKGGNRVVKTSKFLNEIYLPDNFVVIGTMNTADKSVKQLDIALRRRFKFIFVKPDYIGLTEWLHCKGWSVTEFSIDSYVDSLKKINERITKHPTLGKNMTIGQSLFVPKSNDAVTLSEICDVFNDTILPQLEAYIGFGNKKDIDEILGTPDVRMKLMKGESLSEIDLVNLITVLNSAQE